MTNSKKEEMQSAKNLGLSFWKGARYPFVGMRFVYKENLSLARIWIFPILITLAAFASAIYFSWSYSNELTNKILGKVKVWMGSIEYNITDWFVDSYGVLEAIVLGFLIVTTALLVFILIPVFAAPFNDLLSEKIEEMETNKKSSFKFGDFFVSIFQSIGLELLKLMMYLVIMALFFTGSLLLPVVGQALYSIAGFIFTATYFALDYVDWPLSRRKWPAKKRLALIKTYFPTMIGFGCGVWLLLLIPIVNLFFMPAAVAGGTLLFLELEKAGIEI